MIRPPAFLVLLTTAALIAPSVSATPPEMFNPNIVWRDQDINAPYQQFRDYRFSKGADGRASFTITWLSVQNEALVAGPFPNGKSNPSEPVYFEDLGNGRIRTGSNEFQVTLDASGRLNFSRDGKASHSLSSHPPISRDVEIIVNSESPYDDYVTWAPTTCSARLTSSAGRTDPVTVVLTNDAAAVGGDVLFAANQSPQPRFATATQEELTLTLPASGEWVNFVIAGKFGRASLQDKDTIIDVHEGTAEGRILGGLALMVRVRKAAETLTPEERYRFLRSVAMMQRRGGGSADYEFYYRLHANTDVQNVNHGTSTFLPWHRALLLRFERELQANDPSVTLPYWNWQQPPGEIFNPEFLGTGGARVTFDGVTSALSPIFADGLNPIHHFQFHRGENPNNASLAPPRERIEQELTDALAKNDFESFSHTVEDTLHNNLHTWVNGDMALFDSPKDPAFFLHHCSVDRTWAQWQHDLNHFGTASPDFVPFASSDPKRNDKGEVIQITPPQVDTELILGGPIPASQIMGVWPKETIPARPLHMIDYLNANVTDTNLGFCYDNVPFGTRLPGVQNASPAAVTQRDNGRHIFVVAQAAALPSWSDFANVALTEDNRLQAGRRLIVVTDEEGIERLRAIAADRTQAVRIRVMAIQLVPSAPILETLLEILENRENDLEVKKAAAKALQIALFAIHSDQRVRIFNALRQYINDPCPELREVALSILVPHHDAAAVEFVKDSLSGKVADSRLPTVTAIQLLAADDPRKHLNVIRPFLNAPAVAAGPTKAAVKNNAPEVLTAAIEAIGFDPASRPLIVRHLQDRGQPLNVRKAALRAVEEDCGQAVNLAKRVVTDSTESPQLRVAAINSLGGIVSSRVHELNLRSEQVAAGRNPLVIKDDIPAVSADSRASVFDLLKQTACSVESPHVAAEAFRVAHWLRINDPAVRQRAQSASRPAAPPAGSSRPSAGVNPVAPQRVQQPQMPNPLPSVVVPNQVPQSVPNQLRQSVPQSVPNQPRQSVPQSVPNRIQQSVPQPVPNQWQPQLRPSEGNFNPGNQYPRNQIPGNQIPGNQIPGNQYPGNQIPENFNPGSILDLIPGMGEGGDSNYPQQPQQSPSEGNYPGNVNPGNQGEGNYPGNFNPGNQNEGNFNPGSILDLIPGMGAGGDSNYPGGDSNYPGGDSNYPEL